MSARHSFGPTYRGGADGPNPLKNACVRWVQSGRRGMLGYVEGYRRAACAVYEVSIATRTSPDYAVFAIAFLWCRPDVRDVGMGLLPVAPGGKRILRRKPLERFAGSAVREG
jgi:hypothetical protein